MLFIDYPAIGIKLRIRGVVDPALRVMTIDQFRKPLTVT
jgi:hypothetical protein